MKLFVFLILAVFASKNEENAENNPENGERIGNNEKNPILVKIEEDEYVKKKSKHIGVSYDKNKSKWRAQRWSKVVHKHVYNGYYEDEETAAHASDTLARKLMENGERAHKLNFPDDYTEVCPNEKRFSSQYIGVIYNKSKLRWFVQRRSKHESTMVYNGYYENEETAAHASDTLARNLMENGEGAHKLNFPDDYTEVYPEEKEIASKYIGVSYNKYCSKWYARRWSKNEKKTVANGYYGDEETAALASDTLARKLMKNGEGAHKLNFPDDYTENYPNEKQNNKRKRQKDLNLGHPQNK